MEETALLEGKELRGSKKKYKASAVPSVPEVVLTNVSGEGSSRLLTSDGGYVNPIPIPLDGDDGDPRRRPGFVEKVFNEPRKSLVESYLESRDEENPGLRWRRVSISSVTSDAERQSDRLVSQKDVLKETDSEAEPESAPVASPTIRPGFSHDDAPQLSERAATAARLEGLDNAAKKPSVQFEIGNVTDAHENEEDAKAKKHKYRHRDKHRHAKEEDPSWRMRAGSEIHFPELRLPTEVEEASMLPQGDLDDIASHRYDQMKHTRRHRSTHGVLNIVKKEGTDLMPSLRKVFDRQPHEIFVELDELTQVGTEWEWKEKSRWIKYEEDVEEGSNKWGKPHVATLSFHSLLNLRKCLEQGVVLLDMDAEDLPGIMNRTVEQMVISDLIHPEDKGAILRLLLLKHKHVDDHEGLIFRLRRNAHSSASLHNLNENRSWPKLVPSLTNLASHDHGHHAHSALPLSNHGALLTPDGNYHRGSSFGFGAHKSSGTSKDVQIELTEVPPSPGIIQNIPGSGIMRKIPPGAEAATVLVGEADFLEQPAMAFLRLVKGIILPGVTEVPIPVRFVFVLIGPSRSDMDYHEIGCAIATLMSNSGFHDVAYKTETRRDLLSAINEFLDDSIVLPPGEWESARLLPFDDIKAKSREIRNRKKMRIEKELKQEQPHVVVDAASEAEKKAVEAGAVQPTGAPLPVSPGDADDPLQRTGRLFGGFFSDVKRRYPWYLTDLRDAINPVCLATAVFIYFAALSGAITFGGLYADKTGNLIGVSETLIATAGVGVLFALLAGQPLIIVGATGPCLLFDESLYSFCESQGIDFLSMRVWVGIWLAIIGILVTMFEGATFVRLFTRFTEEIFASLISLLFIYESFYKLYNVYVEHPLLSNYCITPDPTVIAMVTNMTEMEMNESIIYSKLTAMSLMPTIAASMSADNLNIEDVQQRVRRAAEKFDPLEAFPRNQPNTALMSTILMLGTFLVAYFLRHFRNSKFLGRNARRALGDFGVPIAIVSMVMIDFFVGDTYTEKLSVPEGLSPSNPDVRGWVISPMGTGLFSIPIWLIFAASLPAILIFILIFMETEICELIINKKCQKGSGYHMDILILCILNVGCAIIGAPWQPAATVRAVSHVSALTIYSQNQAPGEKPKVVEIKEQRVTSLVVAILVGVSVAMAPILRRVPLAVLFGVFLYMGISSTNGIQLFERLRLLFMPVKHHPSVNYVRRVRTWRMHMYTAIQILCLAVLWTVKSTQAALAFPFVLLLMIPIRKLLTKFFTPRELQALDSKGETKADDDDAEPDFYVQAHAWTASN
ncbi:unnamed protein product [Darwinula stevensoni]|uniref:Anion exchange protein n=1 Tax=Darwinula stevensoni TaxID=69355 RepID=A0A7R8X502_9CRUS|nr:unnamed protein product [Darwinula stevensoni]CAG0879882.1 unnamed protein product [Darwinula stevensoni]